MLVTFSCKQRGLCPSCSAKRGAEPRRLPDRSRQARRRPRPVGFHHPQDAPATVLQDALPARSPRPPRLGDRPRPDGGGGRGAGSPAQAWWRSSRASAIESIRIRTSPRHPGRLDARRPLPPRPLRGSGCRTAAVPAQGPFSRRTLRSQEYRSPGPPPHPGPLPNRGRGIRGCARWTRAYSLRPPVSLARLQWLPGGQDVLHFPKGKGDDPGGSSPERIDAMEYVARVLSQIPESRKHQVRYYVARVVM